MLKIDLDRLHKQPKWEKQSGKTFDAVMQLIGTIEVLLENRNNVYQLIPIFVGPSLTWVDSFKFMFKPIFIERIKSNWAVTYEDHNLHIIIGRYIKIKFFSAHSVYENSFSQNLRGCNCTQPIFDADCGLTPSEILAVTKYILPQIR